MVPALSASRFIVAVGCGHVANVCRGPLTVGAQPASRCSDWRALLGAVLTGRVWPQRAAEKAFFTNTVRIR